MTAIEFEKIPIRENNEKLLDVEIFGIVIEPMYFQQGFSKSDKIFLRESVIKKLLKVEKKLKTKGKRLKIWDGYRPRYVQENIYNNYFEQLKKSNPNWSKEKLEFEVSIFVTNPKLSQRIPPHTTGGSIDLTIINDDMSEINMGTHFDYFGKEAGALFYEENSINEDIKSNRKLLREEMLNQEFRFDLDEWWHFDYGNQLWALNYDKEFAIYGEI